MKKAKADFWELAKSRIFYRTDAEQLAFVKRLFGEDSQRRYTAVYVREVGTSGPEPDPEKWVTGLEISVNKDFFGNDFADLIPYAVEHEIYEAWLSVKRGLNPSLEKQHLLARQRQFEMAARDGKAEKLRNFLSTNPSYSDEVEYAYNKAVTKTQRRE